MGKLWTLITQVHSLSGPVLMLLYPLYASVMAIEGASVMASAMAKEGASVKAIKAKLKREYEQWLAYWILYSFLTLMEMLLEPILELIPIWYDVKLLFVGWLVLPQFQGATFLYERYVSKPMKKHRDRPVMSDHRHHKSPNVPLTCRANIYKTFSEFITPKKGEQEAY